MTAARSASRFDMSSYKFITRFVNDNAVQEVPVPRFCFVLEPKHMDSTWLGMRAKDFPSVQNRFQAHLRSTAEASDLHKVDGDIRVGLVLQHGVKGAKGHRHAGR